MEIPPIVVKLTYKNYRDEVALRYVLPVRIWFGTTSIYERAQWLLDVFDFDKNANRTYAVQNILKWEVV